MRQPIILCSPLLAAVVFASSANAATYYTSPTGTATTACTTREAPCDLGSAATLAMAGDTVVLMDGIYKNTSLFVPNSGTASAWITFQADDCAVPIIEGAGVDPTSTDKNAGVSSNVATYVRFVGLVSRGWNTGFSNGWQPADSDAGTLSNGHFEFKDCIGDDNGRTAFTFFSAEGIHIQNCIAAHNGSSTEESWSSGITLYNAQGTTNLVEGSVSFENMDNHVARADAGIGGTHSDGNGFIVDEGSNNATFVNNIAFANGGSCLRLTKSANTTFVNNTCYHNGQDTADMGPTNPGELYFTKDTGTSGPNSTTTGVNFMNNFFVATGTGPGATAIYDQPTSGWASTNLVSTGAATYFTAPDGTNPDFTLLASATTAVGKGGTGAGVPTNDAGFDPKCITKKVPTPIGMMTKGSWWQYSIDYDYIKSIGGVAKCFNPGTRATTGMPDIGAYKAGTVATTTPGTCIPPVIASGGSGGATASGGGAGVGSAQGGSATSGGGAASSTGGAAQTTGGGTTVASGGTSPGTGGTSPTGSGATAATAATSTSSPSSGCGCRVGQPSNGMSSCLGLGSLGLALLGIRRRRQARATKRPS